MRHFLRRLFNACVAAAPVAIIRGFLKAFVVRPDVAERAGFQVYPKVFYSPMPIVEEIDITRLRERRSLPGVALAVNDYLALLRQLTRFAGELAQIPRQKKLGEPIWYENGTYADFDTATLYAMLRHLKPARYIEVGCGFSSRTSSLALEQNRRDGAPCAATYIEPYPPAHLAEIRLPGEFLDKKVQAVPPAVFQELQAGDVLFIDTSHVLKVQNDVEYELLHILPVLRPGVWVHIHDIFTPYDYPEEWLTGPARGGNNEQYALECLLSGGADWEVMLPVHLLWREHRTELERLLTGTKDRPAAFWIRKRKQSVTTP